MTMSLVDLARKSKNLNTLLFAIVWEQVTVGKREQNLFNTLREHVMTTNKLRFNDMLMCIKGSLHFSRLIFLLFNVLFFVGTRDEEDSLKEAEKEIRSAVKDALFVSSFSLSFISLFFPLLRAPFAYLSSIKGKHFKETRRRMGTRASARCAARASRCAPNEHGND